MTLIVPTVGRNVWARERGVNDHDGAQAFHSNVLYVHSDRMVNLIVFDYNGNMLPWSSVPLLQKGDVVDPLWTRWCEWMPYQQGQAKKTEEEKSPAPLNVKTSSLPTTPQGEKA